MSHLTSRTAKIAAIAALAGMMLAVGLASLDREPAPALEIIILPPDEGGDDLGRELERCAALTMPDTACEAAWAQNRRRFFGQDEITLDIMGGGELP